MVASYTLNLTYSYVHIWSYIGLEISTGHWTKSDIKTAMSDAKSPHTRQSWPTCFWAVKNIINDTIHYITVCINFDLTLIILFLILLVFFSGSVSCHSYKEFLVTLFVWKFSSTVAPDNSLHWWKYIGKNLGNRTHVNVSKE